MDIEELIEENYGFAKVFYDSYDGVPVLCIPIYGDNIDDIVDIMDVTDTGVTRDIDIWGHTNV